MTTTRGIDACDASQVMQGPRRRAVTGQRGPATVGEQLTGQRNCRVHGQRGYARASGGKQRRQAPHAEVASEQQADDQHGAQQAHVEDGADTADREQPDACGIRRGAPEAMAGPTRQIVGQHVARAGWQREKLAEVRHAVSDQPPAADEREQADRQPGERRGRAGGLSPSALGGGVGIDLTAVSRPQVAREPRAPAKL